MKINNAASALRRGFLFLLEICVAASNRLTSAFGFTGGTGTRDVIQIKRCEYAVTGAYVEILIDASSSTPGARVLAYLPDGTYLGKILGSGDLGFGTVFVAPAIPTSITLKSSAGALITASCAPYQPYHDHE